jgi:NADH dehydrogenase
LLGGTGFVGRAVAEQLAARGVAITVPTRAINRAKHLLPLPTVQVIHADVHDSATLHKLVAEHDAVINLIGVLHGDFVREHVALPKLIAEICASNNRRLLHMSALNADTTMFQPSVIFGEHDKFLNMFAGLVKVFPVIPLGSATAKFQPVWVEDVARAITTSLFDPSTRGKTYPLVGPKVYTLRELIQFVIAQSGKTRAVIALGATLSMWQAAVLEHLPGKLLTRDNVRSMQVPSTSSVAFPVMFGAASALEHVVAGYARDRAGRRRYQTYRDRAGRV